MTYFTRSAWALMLAVALPSCADAVGPEPDLAPESVEITSTCEIPPVPDISQIHLNLDVEYYAPGGIPQILDLARPLGPGPHPLVVLVHGGAWIAGHPHEFLEEAAQLAAQGYVAASVGYRFAPQFPFPAAVEDLRCALRFLRSRADSLSIDPTRTVLIGASAGGHLTSLVATGPELPFDGSCPYSGSVQVDGAITYYAPFDLEREQDFDVSVQIAINAFLGNSPGADPQTARLASPPSHVDASDPPFLIIQGTADHLVSVAQPRLMDETLGAARVPATYVELPGVEHSFRLLQPTAALRPATCTSLAFLAKTFGS